MDADKIKVLVADDSQVTRMLLVQLLNSDPRIHVIGAVNDGQAALEFLDTVTDRPDVVIMDIHMPRLDGFEATRRIMETRPLPIIICTATAAPQDLAIAFRSMEAGAVACVAKPVALGDDFEPRLHNLLQTVRLMSEVKVVRRWNRLRGTPAVPHANGLTQPGTAIREVRLIGIGASTGGPPVLQAILSGLPKNFPAPILIVQHIAHGFLPDMVDWLSQTTGLRVHIAAHGTAPLPGHAYVAPDDFHLAADARGHMVLAREPAEGGLRPAVSYLFRSLANSYGAHAVGVLLTGMGKDGAAELKRMRDHGALTIAQDRESSIVHGMPGEAIELGAATLILPADKIADVLIAHTGRGFLPAGEIAP
ncbi:MAG: two-component system, chemotaxis family, protein-glutamate methylesterase/glutaminase [Gammaproteobacteria bacterium]|jgi:two-component system chemotaxis response regulator CheB|nr:two-component system, chemotaxis family, protein-glutamate methylesterase/glutaminase [Gammaproteobacteria bacterium]